MPPAGVVPFGERFSATRGTLCRPNHRTPVVEGRGHSGDAEPRARVDHVTQFLTVDAVHDAPLLGVQVQPVEGVQPRLPGRAPKGMPDLCALHDLSLPRIAQCYPDVACYAPPQGLRLGPGLITGMGPVYY